MVESRVGGETPLVAGMLGGVRPYAESVLAVLREGSERLASATLDWGGAGDVDSSPGGGSLDAVRLEDVSLARHALKSALANLEVLLRSGDCEHLACASDDLESAEAYLAVFVDKMPDVALAGDVRAVVVRCKEMVDALVKVMEWSG